MATGGENPPTLTNEENTPTPLTHPDIERRAQPSDSDMESDMMAALQRELVELRLEVSRNRKASPAVGDVRSQQPGIPTRIVLPPPVRLPIYAGKEDPCLWIDRAKRTIETLQLRGKEAVLFLRDYLQGAAEEEARQQLPDTAELLFSALKRVFGSRASSAQIMRDFYTRTQSPSESVMDYSHALISILEKSDLPAPEREHLVRDQFAEGIKLTSLQRLLKRRIRDRPTVTFIQLRDIALDECAETPKVQVKEQSIDYSCNILTSDNSFTDPPAWAKELIDLTKQLLNHKSVANPIPVKCDPPNASQTQNASHVSKSNLQCYYCQKFGHFRRDCQKRLREERQGRGSNSWGQDMSNQGRSAFSRSVGTGDQL